MEHQEKAFYVWVGIKIMAMRKEARMTQQDLGDKIGLSRTSIVNIEKGRQTPPIYTYWEIARVLDVSPGEILPVKNEHTFSDSALDKQEVIEKKNLKERDQLIFSELLK